MTRADDFLQVLITADSPRECIGSYPFGSEIYLKRLIAHFESNPNDTPEGFWDRHDNGSELIYLSELLGASRQSLTLAACAVVRTVLHYVPDAGEPRPRIAIETAEAWAHGKATARDVYGAANDAHASGAHCVPQLKRHKNAGVSATLLRMLSIASSRAACCFMSDTMGSAAWLSVSQAAEIERQVHCSQRIAEWNKCVSATQQETPQAAYKRLYTESESVHVAYQKQYAHIVRETVLRVEGNTK